MKNLFYFEEYDRKGVPSNATGTSNWVRKGCFTFLIVSLNIHLYIWYIYIYISLFVELFFGSEYPPWALKYDCFISVSRHACGTRSLTALLDSHGFTSSTLQCPSEWRDPLPCLLRSSSCFVLDIWICARSMVCEFEMSGERTGQCISLKI